MVTHDPTSRGFATRRGGAARAQTSSSIFNDVLTRKVV